MSQAIHITHEAAKKIGGIGAVLSGMCTSSIYHSFFDRTVFYGPLFDDKENTSLDLDIAINRLGGDAEVLYSSLDKIYNSIYDDFFNLINNKYSIDILYGTKILYDEIHPQKKNKIEILLVGIKHINQELLDLFKFQLWEKYGFSCKDFENNFDFEQYLRIALPFRIITEEIFTDKKKTIYFSHEYMGVASCLAIDLQKKQNEKIYFHAHEISTARSVTEKISGHDISFYNLLENDLKNGKTLENRFGLQKHNPRNELIKLAKLFDGIMAVGDWVKKEYCYLVNDVDVDKINICYNGIPVPNYSFNSKKKARKKLQDYCDNLYNFVPDVIMTHVTRLVISKGLWRDISILEKLDDYFTKDKLKGFMVILSTIIGSGRTSDEIGKMETDYGWPVMHKEGYPDLIGYENDIYWSCQYFNAKSKSIKVVFINQYGFTQNKVGSRLPEDTSFADLRLASDVELGLSVYEPFGIAQIETIPFGGVAILTKACGSSFLLEKSFKDEELKPYLVLDFTEDSNEKSEVDLLNLSLQEREEIEKQIIAKHINEIYNIIPKSEAQRKQIFDLCKKHLNKLSWDEVIKDMPFLKR